MKNPLISIIIANWNGSEVIGPCLKSIFQSNFKNFEVVIVDNGSTDGSLEYLEKLEQEKKIILSKNKTNLGYAMAINQGAQCAKGELLFFLNSDTTIEKNCLDEIAKGFQESIWAAQCKIRQMDRREEIQTLGTLLVPGLAIVIGKKGRGEKDRGQYDKRQPVISSGAAQVIRAEVFERLGQFDSDYFAGYEDIDLAYRIYLAKKEVILLPQAIAYHRDHTKYPMSKLRAKIGAFQTLKNVLLFMIRNYQWANFIKYILPVLAYQFFLSLVPIAKRNFYPLLGYWWGMGWHLVHLPSSFKKRKAVGKIRKNSDQEIFNLVGANLGLGQLFRYIRNGCLA